MRDDCPCDAEKRTDPHCAAAGMCVREWPCPTCKGRGTVNPLTAPKDFFCVSTTECPSCEGTGELI